MLAIDSRYCTLAEAMFVYKERRQIKVDLSMALPVLAGSLFLSPLSAVTLGGAAGIGFSAKEYLYFNERRSHIISYFFGDETGVDGELLSQGKRTFQSNLVLLPLTFAGVNFGASHLKKLTNAKKILLRK